MFFSPSPGALPPLPSFPTRPLFRSIPDASSGRRASCRRDRSHVAPALSACRSSEIGRAHSELQSPVHLVCRLLLEKKNGITAGVMRHDVWTKIQFVTSRFLMLSVKG